MKRSTITVYLLILILFIGAVPTSLSNAEDVDTAVYPFLRDGLQSAVNTLWTGDHFKDSPDADHLHWVDDQGKMLTALTEDYANFSTYANGAADFIDDYEYGGMLLRRKVDLEPMITRSDPTNFSVHNNWLIEVEGDLSQSNNMNFMLRYKQSHFNHTCIQGQSVRYDQSGLQTELVKNPSAEDGSGSPDYWTGSGDTGGTRYGPELVDNSDVETGNGSPYHWYTGGGVWTEDQSYSPTHSLKIDASSQDIDWRAEHFTVEAGADYKVKAWFNGTLTGGEWYLTIRWFNNSDGTDWLSEDNIDISSNTEWTEVEAVKTAPTDADSADIMFRTIGGTGEVYGDDFSVNKKTATQGYVWSSDEAREGSKSLLIDTYNDSAEWTNDHFVAVGDRIYNFTGYVKGTVYEDEFFFTVRWFSDEAGTEFISEDNIAISSGDYNSWTQITQNVTSPTNALSGDVVFRAINGDGKIYADSFYFRKYADDTVEFTYETSITSYSLDDNTPNRVDLIQTVNDGAIKVTFNYSLIQDKPYLNLDVTVENVAGYNLRDVWIHNALDQLSQFGTPTGIGEDPLGYQYLYFPGVGDIKADGSEPQHFLPQTEWNRDYFIVHMRDIPDIFDRSLATAVILENKTLLTDIDNVEVLTPGKLHWLKMYNSLGDINNGDSKHYSMKYVIMNAHNWNDMDAYDQFFSNIEAWEDIDFSLTHQYGTVLLGLSKLYNRSGSYGPLLKRTWNYYRDMYYNCNNGSYLQSWPYAIEATINLYETTGNTTYLDAAKAWGSDLLDRQQLNESAANYGGFREWGGAEYVYLDFEAPAGGALKELYRITGNESYMTARERFVESLFIGEDGGISCYRDPEGTEIDSDIPTYKAALMLVSSTLGLNSTITHYAMSHIWNRTTYTDSKLWINVTYSGLSWGQEPSAESMGWGLAGWLKYAQQARNLYDGKYVIYSYPAIYSLSYTEGRFYINLEGDEETGYIKVFSPGKPIFIYQDRVEYTNWSYNETTNICNIQGSWATHELIIVFGVNEYNFIGLKYENNTDAGAVTVRAIQEIDTSFELNGTYSFYGYEVQYFSWDIDGLSTPRKIAALDSDIGGTYYIFTGESSMDTYAITVYDYTGYWLPGWLEMYRHVGGYLRLVERREYTALGNEKPFNMVTGKTYRFKFRAADGSLYDFGEFIAGTSDQSLELTEVSFTQQVQLAYEHLNIALTRPIATNIKVEYEDTINQTEATTFRIYDRNGTLVYSHETTDTDLFTDIWTLADNETDYRAVLEVQHSFYNNITAEEILLAPKTSSYPWDLSPIGDSHVMDMTQILPVFFVWAIAGSVDAFFAPLGAVLTVIFAGLFVNWGWLDNNYAVLSLAGSLAVTLFFTLWRRMT